MHVCVWDTEESLYQIEVNNIHYYVDSIKQYMHKIDQEHDGKWIQFLGQALASYEYEYLLEIRKLYVHNKQFPGLIPL